jgi:hypothetical protein
MSEPAPTLTRHDLEAKIVKRCWEDKAFHKEFTADPVGTAVKYLEVPAANLPNIVVHEEPAGSWHIVLPEKPASAGELSEEDLEKVAGGSTPACLATLFAIPTLLIGGITAGGVVSRAKGW